MRIFLLLALLTALLLALAPSAPSLERAARTGSVTGSVSDARGTAVAEAVVQIQGVTASGRRYADRTATDRSGAFGFRAVPAGRYAVSTEVRGLGADSERVGVRAGATTHVRLVLQ